MARKMSVSGVIKKSESTYKEEDVKYEDSIASKIGKLGKYHKDKKYKAKYAAYKK